VYFDTATRTIGPEHIMASAALPPDSPPWRSRRALLGRRSSLNTPLKWLVDSRPHLDTLTFQVDLWSARGELPRTSRGIDPPKGNPVLESHPRRHR